MRYLGVDYGRKRVGIALSDESGTFAFPNSVVTQQKAENEIVGLALRNGVTTIVMGQSIAYSGVPNEIQKEIDLFRDALEARRLEVIYEQEFLTSEQAKRVQADDDMHDARAAALILQAYLDRRS